MGTGEPVLTGRRTKPFLKKVFAFKFDPWERHHEWCHLWSLQQCHLSTAGFDSDSNPSKPLFQTERVKIKLNPEKYRKSLLQLKVSPRERRGMSQHVPLTVPITGRTNSPWGQALPPGCLHPVVWAAPARGVHIELIKLSKPRHPASLEVGQCPAAPQVSLPDSVQANKENALPSTLIKAKWCRLPITKTGRRLKTHWIITHVTDQSFYD